MTDFHWNDDWFTFEWCKKRAKNAFLAFLALFWAHVGHLDGHIGWATLMPFASIYPTDPRTNPWNFCEKILRIGGFENSVFNTVAESGLKYWSSRRNVL